MRSLSYFILAYLLLALQLGLNGYLNVGQLAPNLVLPAVVFFAINTKREEALVASFLLGLAHDLFSQRPSGIFAFSYALAALFSVGLQASVKRDHPLTHFSVSLAAALLTNALLWFNDWAYPILHHISASRPSILSAIGNTIYTAIASTVILGLLSRLKFVFGITNRPYHRSVGYVR